MAATDSSITPQRAREDRAIYRAMRLLENRMRMPGELMHSPSAVLQFLTLHLAQKEREIFTALWLDAQHRVIVADDLFLGTLTQTTVHPREVLKRALQLNAAAVIFAHNHPSGCAEPSYSDKWLTDVLKRALAVIEVQVLDHVIVAGASTLSFAERGMLDDEQPKAQPETKRRRGRPRKAVQTATA